MKKRNKKDPFIIKKDPDNYKTLNGWNDFNEKIYKDLSTQDKQTLDSILLAEIFRTIPINRENFITLIKRL